MQEQACQDCSVFGFGALPTLHNNKIQYQKISPAYPFQDQIGCRRSVLHRLLQVVTWQFSSEMCWNSWSRDRGSPSEVSASSQQRSHLRNLWTDIWRAMNSCPMHKTPISIASWAFFSLWLLSPSERTAANDAILSTLVRRRKMVLKGQSTKILYQKHPERELAKVWYESMLYLTSLTGRLCGFRNVAPPVIFCLALKIWGSWSDEHREDLLKYDAKLTKLFLSCTIYQNTIKYIQIATHSNQGGSAAAMVLMWWCQVLAVYKVAKANTSIMQERTWDPSAQTVYHILILYDIFVKRALLVPLPVQVPAFRQARELGILWYFLGFCWSQPVRIPPDSTSAKVEKRRCTPGTEHCTMTSRLEWANTSCWPFGMQILNLWVMHLKSFGPIVMNAFSSLTTEPPKRLGGTAENNESMLYRVYPGVWRFNAFSDYATLLQLNCTGFVSAHHRPLFFGLVFGFICRIFWNLLGAGSLPLFRDFAWFLLHCEFFCKPNTSEQNDTVTFTVMRVLDWNGICKCINHVSTQPSTCIY